MEAGAVAFVEGGAFWEFSRLAEIRHKVAGHFMRKVLNMGVLSLEELLSAGDDRTWRLWRILIKEGVVSAPSFDIQLVTNILHPLLLIILTLIQLCTRPMF